MINHIMTRNSIRVSILLLFPCSFLKICSLQLSHVPSSFSQPPALHRSSPTALQALVERQFHVYDGAELQSFFRLNPSSVFPSPRDAPEGVACLILVTGTINDKATSQRIVGVEKVSKGKEEYFDTYDTVALENNVHVYQHTMANIPDNVSDRDAISTAAMALVGIHCAVPRLNVGGGTNQEIFYSGKAVVVGGNEYACFIADGLATLGIDTYIVSKTGARVKNKQVKIMEPAILGNDGQQTGFTTIIGQFDSFIDTIANERLRPQCESSVIQLLKSKHQCNNYISTLTCSQQIIMKDGVIFGPGKANAHLKSLESMNPNKCTALVPSLGFGPSTLQLLLNNNIIFTKRDKKEINRGWSMKEFWEETSWPRDSSGTGARFGLPVVDDEDLDAIFQKEKIKIELTNSFREINSRQNMEKAEKAVKEMSNPFVIQLEGVAGLVDHVISKQRNCVVFVAMRSCRTCKGINPIYTKLAKEYSGDMMFAKADATGETGKTLGRQLGVATVPSFVLFRNGIRYGLVSASKLPSSRLEKAINDLEAGKDFDSSLEQEADS